MYSQVMTVRVQQEALTRALQRITSNENNADFQIYF